jgi:ABC-type cobalamin transport system permease subunit
VEADSRVLYTAIWGGGSVVLATVIVVARLIIFRRRRDRRSMRDFLQGVCLGLVAFASALAIAAVLIAPDSVDIRGFLVWVALGAFAGALIIAASDALEQLKQ